MTLKTKPLQARGLARELRDRKAEAEANLLGSRWKTVIVRVGVIVGTTGKQSFAFLPIKRFVLDSIPVSFQIYVYEVVGKTLCTDHWWPQKGVLCVEWIVHRIPCFLSGRNMRWYCSIEIFAATVGIGCCIAGWDSHRCGDGSDGSLQSYPSQVHLAKRDFHEALDCAKSRGLKGEKADQRATSQSRRRSSVVECNRKTCCKTTVDILIRSWVDRVCAGIQRNPSVFGTSTRSAHAWCHDRWLTGVISPVSCMWDEVWPWSTRSSKKICRRPRCPWLNR